MKTIKRILIAGLFIISMNTFANTDKVITVSSDDVTITKDGGSVDISILNTQENTYTLYIFNPNGELVFDEKLGNDTSLGKRFDFDWALEGNYIFTLTNDAGERSTHTVRVKL